MDFKELGTELYNSLASLQSAGSDISVAKGQVLTTDILLRPFTLPWSQDFQLWRPEYPYAKATSLPIPALLTFKIKTGGQDMLSILHLRSAGALHARYAYIWIFERLHHSNVAPPTITGFNPTMPS